MGNKFQRKMLRLVFSQPRSRWWWDKRYAYYYNRSQGDGVILSLFWATYNITHKGDK